MKLFIYGELQNPYVQIKIFGKEVDGIYDTISNWIVLNDFDKGKSFLQLASQPKGIVFGHILDLTEEQVEKLDSYEEDYFRYSLKTDKGIDVQTYVRDNDKLEDNYFSS
jgi:hypothetical protein